MSPRDPFAGMGSKTAVPEEPAEAIPEVLARRPSRAKRNRDWEREQPRVTYRGIPPELNEELLKLAGKFSVPVGEIARAFIEYGLQAYYEGKLQLTPQLKVGKMTLFPAGEAKRGKR